MTELEIPDLTFPGVRYGKRESPYNMRIFLYRGGAKARKNRVNGLIDSAQLGSPIAARLPLVMKLHEILLSTIAAGGRKLSVEATLSALRLFYDYADTAQRDPTATTASELFVGWIETRQHKQRLKQLKARTVYDSGCMVAAPLAEATGVSTRRLLRAARLRRRHVFQSALGTKADKQNLSDTFAFGQALLDITESLSVEAIRGSLPVEIRFRNGAVRLEWSGLIPESRVKSLDRSLYGPAVQSRLENIRQRWMADTSHRTRYPLINLRMEAELLMFIAQTGMNLTQALELKVGKFVYQSHHDGYQIRRTYKHRMRGEVEFEIFSEYRSVFESYLVWRSVIHPTDTDGLLFPFVAAPNKSVGIQRYARRTHALMREIGVPFVGPRSLRKTRINWLLRRSDDPDLTAEQAQHSKETLLRVYQMPHHQRAATEATRFWQQTDPSISPPGPGLCVERSPIPILDTPPAAPPPDCTGPAGCLFCIHQRDIDSLDHVWSLTSFRYLKSLEHARYGPEETTKARGHRDDAIPPALAIARITDKLRAFEASSRTRMMWVKEAQARIDEDEFHPRWDGFIQLAELQR